MGTARDRVLFSYIGLLLILIQGVLVPIAVKRFDEANCMPAATAAMTIGIGMI